MLVVYGVPNLNLRVIWRRDRERLGLGIGYVKAIVEIRKLTH